VQVQMALVENVAATSNAAAVLALRLTLTVARAPMLFALPVNIATALLGRLALRTILFTHGYATSL
jgi:hypothetical protein